MPIRNQSILHLSLKGQIAILFIILSCLVVATSIPYGFVNFLQRLGAGDPFSLTLTISIIGIIFFLLEKLGLTLAYKEEIEVRGS